MGKFRDAVRLPFSKGKEYPPEDAILLLISQKFAKGCIALSIAEGYNSYRPAMRESTGRDP